MNFHTFILLGEWISGARIFGKADFECNGSKHDFGPLSPWVARLRPPQLADASNYYWTYRQISEEIRTFKTKHKQIKRQRWVWAFRRPCSRAAPPRALRTRLHDLGYARCLGTLRLCGFASLR
jgi:hypothetical protein